MRRPREWDVTAFARAVVAIHSIAGVLELVLELDHINGVGDDHRLENLRLLCPNCHSQTETYCGRNIRIGRKRTRA